MSIGTILSKVKVFSGSHGEFKTACPVDKSHRLTIRETSTGVVQIACNGGCSTIRVVNELRLSTEDIFPPNYFFQVKKQHPEETYLQAFLDIIQAYRKAGHPISKQDKQRELDAFMKLKAVK